MNFKIFLIVCAVIFYEAKAAVVPEANYGPLILQNGRLTLQGAPEGGINRARNNVWSAWRPAGTSPVNFVSPGGFISGLTWNLLGLIGDGVGKITDGITSAVTGGMQLVGQLGSDINHSINPQTPVVINPFNPPPPPETEPVILRPTGRPPPPPPAELARRTITEAVGDFQKLNGDVQNLLEPHKD